MQAAYRESGSQLFYVLQRDIDPHHSKNQLILVKFQNVSMYLHIYNAEQLQQSVNLYF